MYLRLPLLFSNMPQAQECIPHAWKHADFIPTCQVLRWLLCFILLFNILTPGESSFEIISKSFVLIWPVTAQKYFKKCSEGWRIELQMFDAYPSKMCIVTGFQLCLKNSKHITSFASAIQLAQRQQVSIHVLPPWSLLSRILSPSFTAPFILSQALVIQWWRTQMHSLSPKSR